MRKHKAIYKEHIPGGLYKYTVVMRHHPFRNKINKIMYWANEYKWDRSYYKNYNHE